MTDEAASPRDDDQAVAALSGMPAEVESTAGLVQRGSATAERELALVDRIIALENKLAEAKRRYETPVDEGPYPTPPALPEPPLRFQTARDMYSVILRVPVLGSATRGIVKGAKKIRTARR